MKQVWKCDYCSHTNQKFEMVEEHENKCCFNPKLKNCYTCKNYVDHPSLYDDYYICSLGLDTDVFDSKPCDSWLINLENLKNNIEKF